MWGHTYWGATAFPVPFWGCGDVGPGAYAIEAAALPYGAAALALSYFASANQAGGSNSPDVVPAYRAEVAALAYVGNADPESYSAAVDPAPYNTTVNVEPQ